MSPRTGSNRCRHTCLTVSRSIIIHPFFYCFWISVPAPMPVLVPVPVLASVPVPMPALYMLYNNQLQDVPKFTWLLYPQTGSCNFAHWYIRTVPILGYLSVVVVMSYVKYWIFSEFLKFGQIYVFAYTLTWDYMAAVLKLRKFQTAVSPKVRNIESPNGYQKKGLNLCSLAITISSVTPDRK